MRNFKIKRMFYFWCGLFLLILAIFISTQSPQPIIAASNSIVISQVYGGGGNSGAPYTHDFIELFNRSNTAVTLTGWQIKVASATGTFGAGVSINASIPAGGYFLIQLSGGSTGQTLPQPDQTSTLSLSATAGKVILLDENDSTIDLIGFGSSANQYEGTGPAASLDNTKAAIRLSNGCTDSDNNNTDFQAASPSPRNSSSALQPCSATATLTATASATVIPSLTATSTSSPSATLSPTTTQTPTPSTSTLTPSPSSTSTPPSATATPTTTPQSTNTATATATPSPTSTSVPNRNIIINEFDVDTPGSDIAEFMELFSLNGGDQSLDGLVIVFYDGLTHKSYYATSLNGYRTESDGYFVLGNSAISAAAKTFANGTLQNGPDAIALYIGSITDFPNGTAITTTNLLDAVVYGTDDEDDPILLSLLNPAQPQINESAGGSSSTQSNQRCANGSGGQRNTNTFSPNAPNPGAANICPTPSPTPMPTEAPTKVPTATKIATATKTPAPTETAIWLIVPSDTPTPTPDPSQRTQNNSPDDELMRRLVYRHYLMEIHAEDGE